MVPPLVFVFLVTTLTLVGALNNTFIASPNVNIRPPFPTNSKLLLRSAYLILDIDNGAFYSNWTLMYSDQSGPRELNAVRVNGYVLFTANPALIRFDFAATNTSLSCTEVAVNSPPMCPYLQTLLSSSWSYGTYPANGSNVIRLDIQAYADPADPNTGKQMNFLGATIPFSWTCSGTCRPLNNVVPISGNNGTFDVRFLG